MPAIKKACGQFLNQQQAFLLTKVFVYTKQTATPTETASYLFRKNF